jgi:hypothetical protein
VDGAGGETCRLFGWGFHEISGSIRIKKHIAAYKIFGISYLHFAYPLKIFHLKHLAAKYSIVRGCEAF